MALISFLYVAIATWLLRFLLCFSVSALFITVAETYCNSLRIKFSAPSDALRIFSCDVSPFLPTDSQVGPGQDCGCAWAPACVVTTASPSPRTAPHLVMHLASATWAGLHGVPGPALSWSHCFWGLHCPAAPAGFHGVCHGPRVVRGPDFAHPGTRL